MAKMANKKDTGIEAVSVHDAKDRFSELLGRVAFGGETVLITRRGRPMAKLVPPNAGERPAHLADAPGWLEGDHPFFQAVDEVVGARVRHVPRVIRQSRRRGR